ncbi:tRNA synthetase, partial [Oryctes borbonicus]
MATLSEKILQHLDENYSVTTLELAKIFGEDHQKIIGGVKSIQALGDLITADPQNEKLLELTEEGHSVVDKGSHEAMVFNAIPEAGISQKELITLPNGKVGFSKAMSCGWILLDKNGATPLVKKKVAEIVDVVQNHLRSIKAGNLSEITDNLKQEYKKRKLIQEAVIKYYLLQKGPEFSTTLSKLETDLTADMLASGTPLESGYLHPLLKVRAEFRQIFLEMGFAEMPTNNFIENSFWNFDALFQPQQHPARDAHDTFFISDPSVATKFPLDYLEKVKKVHSEGGYGSIGYRYDWKLTEAQKNLLRTHTTAVSARMLYQVGQMKHFKPSKFFSIDRVFRNETLDATHLAEFHQVEGVIADYNLTLGDLIGVFTEFFRKLGITELEFKPAYNPYTEPSMEIFCYHPG